MSAKTWEYFVLNSSRVRFSSSNAPFMNSSFSLYKFPASAIVPISASHFFCEVNSYAVLLEGMYPWSTVSKAKTFSGNGYFG